MTGTFVAAMAHRSVPATPLLHGIQSGGTGTVGTGSGAPSRPLTTPVPAPADSPRSSPLTPSAVHGEHAMRAKLQQEALAIQEALDEEARYM